MTSVSQKYTSSYKITKIKKITQNFLHTIFWYLASRPSVGEFLKSSPSKPYQCSNKFITSKIVTSIRI